MAKRSAPSDLGPPSSAYKSSQVATPNSSVSDLKDESTDCPTSKKRKMTPLMPIVFTSPGKKADTRMMVFNQEFQVYSEGIKMNSMFFQKFFGHQNQATSTSVFKDWKYEWFTMIEEDGGWCLTSDPKGHEENSTKVEETAFNNILRALFLQQSVIGDGLDLMAFTELADYYLCLPAAQNSLHASLLHNHILNADIQKDCVMLLECAYKLRHEVLFRDCLIHTLGPFSKPKCLELVNPTLRNLANSELTKLKVKLCGVQTIITEIINDSKAADAQKIIGLAADSKGSNGRLALACWFRKLYQLEGTVKDCTGASLVRYLDPVLKNNLRVGNSNIPAGEGRFKDSFLCTMITKSQLPWDLEQKDW
ncbi:hypothetical protein BJ875DRAFT_442136 [Amylocarpus encephaloides]|uniref:BTB domain-containing protein n=1 Tax=Amylocarpus encephaloides TaxID=45428 RepID=A0A9P8C4V8_9HELO|nr:hypothetical protein BJ875DRAFT_442136 [Amylocarpus encephaloides]